MRGMGKGQGLERISRKYRVGRVMQKAVCLLSGGLDSCVAAYRAKEADYEIYPLTFQYGQRHAKEITAAQTIAPTLTTQKHIMMELNLKQLGGSSLLEHDLPLTYHDIKDVGQRIPATYVPGRNTIFLSVALAYAETLDAKAIYIGATATDYSGYPDCRPDYFQAFQRLADLATKRGIKGNPITINTPLLYLTKKEIIQEGLRLKAPLHQTWSCYAGGQKACGKCDSCLLRLKGFAEAGIPDPIPYETVPDWYKP
jgi:7-cyano-7-deazaguanine synthase